MPETLALLRTLRQASLAQGKRVFGRWAIVLIGLVMAQGSASVALILVARQIEPTVFGEYLSAFALASLLLVLPNFGLDSWVLAQGTSERSALKAAFGGALGARFRLLGLWLVVIELICLFLLNFPGPFSPILLAFIAIGLAADSTTLLSYSALRNLGRFGQVALYQTIGGVCLLALVLALPTSSTLLLSFALLRALVSVGMALVVLSQARRAFGASERSDASIGRTLREARPFFLSDIAVALSMRADLVLVSAFLGAAGAGIYGPALNLVNLSFLIPNALYLILMPALARSFGNRRSIETRSILGGVGTQAIVGLVQSLALLLLSPLIIRVLFGDAYSESTMLLLVMSPLPLIKSLTFGLAAPLTAVGWQSWRSGAQWIAAITNIVLNIILINTIGLVGAAIAYICSELLLLLAYILGLWRWKRSTFREATV